MKKLIIGLLLSVCATASFAQDNVRIVGRGSDGIDRPVGATLDGKIPTNPASSNIATGQVSVGTTATLIAAARPGRTKIAVTVTTAVQCAFGNTGVTLSTGWPLAATAYVSDNWDNSAALYGVCASTATVGYREQY